MKTITVLARIKEQRESGREGERVRRKVGEWESGRITNYQLSITHDQLQRIPGL
jgi:hypothetical protein